MDVIHGRQNCRLNGRFCSAQSLQLRETQVHFLKRIVSYVNSLVEDLQRCFRKVQQEEFAER